jgi:hypothetical protein
MTAEKTGRVECIYVTIARQRYDKHVSAAADTHVTIEKLLEAIFPVRSVWRLYNKGEIECTVKIRNFRSVCRNCYSCGTKISIYSSI